MAQVIGQRYVIYNFASQSVRDKIPLNGEEFYVQNTNKMGSMSLQLVGNGVSNIFELYNLWEVRYADPVDITDLQNRAAHIEETIRNVIIERGSSLTAFDFGTEEPLQEDLTNYALSQLTTITDPLQIWDGTNVVNLYNRHLWVLKNEQDSDPPIFEWSDHGDSETPLFSINTGGIIIGADPQSDQDGMIEALPSGKGIVKGWDQLLKEIFLLSHPVGSVYTTVSPDESTPQAMEEKHGGTWEVFGQGRMLMGAGSAKANTVTTYGGDLTSIGMVNRTDVEERGGWAEHKLETTEMPHHRHNFQGATASGIASGGSGVIGYASTSRVTDYEGGAESHNNTPLYVTVYMYKRLA